MSGAEGIVDVVAVGSVSVPRNQVVGLLAGVETEVFEQQQRPGLGVRYGVETVGDELDRPIEGRRQHSRNRSQGKGRVGLPLGLAEVGTGGYDVGALEKPAQGGKGGDNAGVVQDIAVTNRNVEVESGQHPRTVDIVEIGKSRKAHALLPAHHVLDQIHATQRVRVFVVVPCDHPKKVLSHLSDERQVDDR